MSLDKRFYIHTGKDGILQDTNEADVRTLVEELKKSAKVVIHLHGGLVTKEQALEKAERLKPTYLQAGAHPIFMIWESGFVETIGNNLQEINKEKIFALVVKKLLKYTVGKLTDLSGAKATGQLRLPNDIEVATEFNKRQQNEVPFSDVRPVPNLKGLIEAERKRFEDALATDIDFQNEVQAIVNGARPEAESKSTTTKGITALHRRSTQTLMSPKVVDDLVADAAEKEGKGIFSTAKLILIAGTILKRIIERFIAKRDHGVYATIIEEVLREFYLANVGAMIWNMMKKDTADTFEQISQHPTRAGWFFVQELARMITGGHQPEISVVAHSAGAIYACHLLEHLDWARNAPNHALPEGFKLKHLMFLAPACDFALFDRALTSHSKAALFEDFRMFALSDRLESGYWEVPAIYPRSLLYFVSGIVEKEHDESAYDLPLVGMERYYRESEIYSQPEIERVRQFLMRSTDHRSEVWSEDDRGAGLASDALRHGGFDSTQERSKTIAAVNQILKEGW